MVATSLHVWLGPILFALGAVLWLGVMAKVDVIIAYPFVDLGFILTALFGVFCSAKPFLSFVLSALAW